MIEKRYAGMGAGIGIPEKLSVERIVSGKIPIRISVLKSAF